MSENTKPRGCGQREVIGHGQNHFCGDELWGEVVYCDSCNLKAAKARIAELEADLAAMGGDPAEAKPRVYVGTIGHVDRGKHTLTAALTRLAEPQQPEAQAGGAVEPVAWRIFWSSSPLSAVELTSDLDRVERVRKLAEDVRVEALYTTPPAPVVPEATVVEPDAWLVEWKDGDDHRRRAQLHTRIDHWLSAKEPTLVALFRRPSPVVPEGMVLAEVLHRVAADPDGLLVLARLAKAETGRLRERFAAIIAAAPEPGEG